MAGQILIVDDHEFVRRGIRSVLSARPDWKICGEAEDGLEAVEKAKSLSPDVVLMDISMPRMDGLEASRLIRKSNPDAKIVIVSQNDPRVVVRQVQEVNASGYVAKNQLAQNLVPTLEKLLGTKPADLESTSKRANAPSSSLDWLSGGGELGRLIREYDWERTPLGALDGWPQSLKTSVSLILNSQHPMWIGWGREATFLYNDAYIQVLSLAKHPSALGQPAAKVWAEIWDVCGPLADKVFQKGEASFVDDVRLFMNRGDILEETYYSFSYSPIRDESGKVAGLFCPSTEVTPKVINARRLRTLSQLSASALVQKTTEAACAAAAATLSKNLDDVPFAALYLTNSDGKSARLEQTFGLARGVGSLTPISIDLAGDNGPIVWPIGEVVQSVQAQVVSVRMLDGLPLGTAQQRITDAIVLPVTSRGEERPLGVLVAGVNPCRRLDTEYRTFFELIAGQIATAIQSASAAEEERSRLDALAEIDRAKTAFFSNVSHEFRTPLTLMLGPIEELLSRSHTDLSPAAKSQLELANRNGSRLLRLVNTLLDFSRIEAGRMQATYEPTDLAAFTVELASVFRSATEKAGLKLDLDCPKLDERIFIDRNMWEKIVLNLVSNAFKFTFEGKIGVSLAKVADHVELRVSDTGVGIPAGELPRLFDRFHRVENTRSRTHEGSGIGLALVNELAKLHGGSVRVESVFGEGSTFIVSVPIGDAHLPADRVGGARILSSTAIGAAPFVEEALRWLPDAEVSNGEDEISSAHELMPIPCPPEAPGETASEGRPMILVADDNADMRQYLVRLLGERYDVHAVPDGQAALAAILERKPELVLSDVMMPQLDGFGLLRELRSGPETRTIPIILLSARAGEESRVEGMERGADDYLIKPFSARELLARVQTHLQMARLRKAGEDAVRRRNEQFTTLLNEAPLGVFLVDQNFRLREVNPTGRSTFAGIPDLIGRDFDEVVHIVWPEPYANDIVERFRHTLETGEPYVARERMEERRDRGVHESYEWQISRIPLADGGYGVVCYFRDVSLQVQARMAISESEERLSRALDVGGLGAWELDLVKKEAWRSRQHDEIFGYRTMLPKWNYETFLRHVLPDDRDRVDREFQRSMTGLQEWEVECRIRRADGVVRWIWVQGAMEVGDHVAPYRMKGMVRDITERRQAEEELREKERRLALATEAAELGIWHWYPDEDRATWENNRVYEVMGRSRVDGPLSVAEFKSSVLHPDDRAPFENALAETVTTGARFFYQGRIRRSNDAWGWVEFTAQPEYRPDGSILRLMGTTLDITARKQADESLRQHRERFDLVAQASNVGFWFCDLPFDKLIWDKRVKEHFWLPPDADVTIDTFFDRIHPNDRERTRKAIEHSNANDTFYDIEYRTVSPEGREKWIRAMGRTFYDAAHQPKSFDGLTLDITERKQAEERERQMTAEAVAATAKFRALFDQTPVFAGIMTADGTLMDANRLCLDACGYKSAEVLGRYFWDTPWWRLSKETQEKLRVATAQASKGDPYRETFTYHWADGTERLVDFSLHPIRDPQGNILFLHPTGIDITELKRAEENYRTLAETLEAAVRTRTEELETRNSEVLFQSEQLRDLSRRLLQAQDEERRRIARELHDSAGQILAALGMNLARISQQANSESKSEVEDSERLVQQLSQEIRTMSYLLHPPLLEDTGLSSALDWYITGLAERGSLEIRLEISPEFGRLPREMELVMFRLVQECLTNIHRHSGSKSAVIRLVRETDSVVLEVEDQGKGISAQKLTEIQSKGAGVGIRGMRERIRLFAGEMEIQSNGHGTKISFKFPLPLSTQRGSQPSTTVQQVGT